MSYFTKIEDGQIYAPGQTFNFKQVIEYCLSKMSELGSPSDPDSGSYIPSYQYAHSNMSIALPLNIPFLSETPYNFDYLRLEGGDNLFSPVNHAATFANMININGESYKFMMVASNSSNYLLHSSTIRDYTDYPDQSNTGIGTIHSSGFIDTQIGSGDEQYPTGVDYGQRLFENSYVMGGLIQGIQKIDGNLNIYGTVYYPQYGYIQMKIYQNNPKLIFVTYIESNDIQDRSTITGSYKTNKTPYTYNPKKLLSPSKLSIANLSNLNYIGDPGNNSDLFNKRSYNYKITGGNFYASKVSISKCYIPFNITYSNTTEDNDCIFTYQGVMHFYAEKYFNSEYKLPNSYWGYYSRFLGQFSMLFGSGYIARQWNNSDQVDTFYGNICYLLNIDRKYQHNSSFLNCNMIVFQNIPRLNL